MDAESLVQIERVVATAVTTAVSGAEDRLRRDMGTLEGRLRKETETIVTTALSGAEERLRKATETLVTTAVSGAEGRHGILYEEMCRRFDLVVESYQTVLDGQKNIRQMIEHESLETRALVQLSYRQLQERVDTLERRVLIIEKHVGLSA